MTLPELSSPPTMSEGLAELSDEERAQAIQTYVDALAVYETATAELTAPVQVAAVGFGLTLIRREAIEAVRSIYPNPVEFDGTKGEDLVFCLRAAEMGFESWLVPRARIGHVKAVVV